MHREERGKVNAAAAATGTKFDLWRGIKSETMKTKGQKMPKAAGKKKR